MSLFKFSRWVAKGLASLTLVSLLFWISAPRGAVGDETADVKVGLEVGNRAPDILGEDIDGVKFKLSDYRGKVVMLDFWGDW